VDTRTDEVQSVMWLARGGGP